MVARGDRDDANKPFTAVDGRREIRSFVLREGRAGAFVDCLVAVPAGERPATDGPAGVQHQGWFA